MDTETEPGMLKAAVIGAGPSGLAAIKCCKEEGIDVVCFEKAKNYGGLWRYSNTEDNTPASKSLLSLFSKEMDAYSDFPPAKNLPNYLNSTWKLNYLKSYIENFKLFSHILFQKEVLEIKQSENFEITGQWVIKHLDMIDNAVKEDVFDCVFVCSGRRQFLHVPKFLDQEIFRGQIIHSKYLNSPLDYQDLNVLVIGFGNSAVEAAVSLSVTANQVYLSVRNGRWLVQKSGKKGLPGDTQYLRRHISRLEKIFPDKMNAYWENSLMHKLDHDKFKIKPNIPVLQNMPLINDDLPDKILTARVIIKGEVGRFVEDGVIFRCDKEVTKLDCIILATGYETKFPFLEERFWTTYNEDSNLYKHVFPVGVNHNTLAIIGQVQPLGPLIPVAESQCRWATRIFKKKVSLPSQLVMENNLKTQAVEMRNKFPFSSRLCPHVDYVGYMDELSSQFGANPNIKELFITDPKLFFACCFGPCLSYQYRIHGPNSWLKAREAILKSKERIQFPLETKATKIREYEVPKNVSLVQ